MKCNKFLVTLALCALIQSPMTIGSQEQQTTQSSQWIPQRLQDFGTAVSHKAASAYQSTRDYAASWVPQSIKDRVNTWSTKKKMAVAAATLGALLAIYNRDYLINWTHNIIDPSLTKEQCEALGLPNDTGIRLSNLKYKDGILYNLTDHAQWLARGIIGEGWHTGDETIADIKAELENKLLVQKTRLQSTEPGTEKYFLISGIINEIEKYMKKHNLL